MTVADDDVEWLVPAGHASAASWTKDGYEPLYRRILAEATRPDLGDDPTTG